MRVINEAHHVESIGGGGGEQPPLRQKRTAANKDPAGFLRDKRYFSLIILAIFNCTESREKCGRRLALLCRRYDVLVVDSHKNVHLGQAERGFATSRLRGWYY